MADQTEWEKGKKWEQPKCKGCGVPIGFVQAKNKAGVIKAHPINIDAAFLLVSTGTKDEKGKWIYEMRKGYISHFSTCPAAAEFRNKKPAADPAAAPEAKKEYKTDEEFTNSLDNDKPPF